MDGKERCPLLKILIWLFSIPLIISVIVLVSYIIFKASSDNKNNNDKPKEDKPGPSRWKIFREKLWLAFTHPAFFIAVGITVLNWLTWALSSSFWHALWANQGRFWAINIGLWICLVLLLVKGEDGKNIHPIARRMSKAIGIMLIAIMILAAYDCLSIRSRFGNTGGYVTSKNQVPITISDVPLEVARRVICECETGCQQFEPGTKIPFRNKGIPSKGVKPSSAFGKYQFLESHREPADKLGFKLNTEEGQDKYFEYLYGKEGFGPWNHDEQYGGGPACWGPKLVALGYGKAGEVSLPVQLALVDVPKGEWSKEVQNPRRAKVTWGRPDRDKGGNCLVMFDRDPQKVVLISAQTHYGPKILQFRCSEEGAKMEVLRTSN